MTRKESTHHVVHPRTGLELKINISPQLKQRLEGTDFVSRDKARKSICIRFREACRKVYPDAFVPRFIEWRDIVVTEIPRVKPTERRCCGVDSCVSCDIGYHERCRLGCTYGR